MCGIVGVIGKITVKEEKAFLLMLMFDTIRGADSTGIIIVDRKGNVKYDKKTGTPWELFSTSPLINSKHSVNGFPSMLIGHNRAATVGKVTEDNAHPFDFENVIGVHNGTLQLYDCDFEGKRAYDVDSQSLFGAINENGLKETIKDTCGAYSLALYEKDTQTFKLLRNDQRPMWWAYSKEHKTVFFASEPWMIRVACEKADIKICNPVATTVDKVYGWKLEESMWDEKAPKKVVNKKAQDGIYFYVENETTPGKKPRPHVYAYTSRHTSASSVLPFKQNRSTVQPISMQEILGPYMIDGKLPVYVVDWHGETAKKVQPDKEAWINWKINHCHSVNAMIAPGDLTSNNIEIMIHGGSGSDMRKRLVLEDDAVFWVKPNSMWEQRTKDDASKTLCVSCQINSIEPHQVETWVDFMNRDLDQLPSDKDKKKLIDIEEDEFNKQYEIFPNNYVDKNYVENVLKAGCAMCGSCDSSLEDFNKISFRNDGGIVSVICEECIKEDKRHHQITTTNYHVH